MGFLDDLLGSTEQQDQYRNFAERYDQGAPYDRIPDEEAINRYQQVAPELSRDEYEQSARESFSRMEPEERQQFGQQLREQSQQQGSSFPDQDHPAQDKRFQDPDYLAGLTSQMHQEQPGMMGELLGGMPKLRR